MSEDKRNLNGHVNELAGEVRNDSLTRVIEILQKAGFCVYSSEDKGVGISFAVPCATIQGIPQSYFSKN